MKVISFICAKGSSQRLPRKNMLPFAGRPLVEWSMIQSRASRYFTDYYMVTDDKEIADLAIDYGYTIVWQSAESARTAGHLGAPICYNLLVDAIRGQYADDDCIVNLLPTSPCRKPEDIDNGIIKYMQLAMANPGKNIEVGTLCRRKDISLMAEEPNGEMKAVLFDNLGKFYVTNGSYGITNYGLDVARYPDIVQAHKEFMAGVHYPFIYRGPDVTGFVENDQWQEWDIDRMSDFLLCERLFVTNGLGDEAYKRYNLGRDQCIQ